MSTEPGPDEVEWVRRIAALTAEPEPDHVAPSPSNPEQLALGLGALARACVLDPWNGHRRLVAIPGWVDAATLAADLARCGPGSAVAPLSGIELALRYVETLRAAAGAVYWCRRMQHAANACWFSTTGPGDGLCGRVLTVGHVLRAPAASPAMRSA